LEVPNVNIAQHFAEAESSPQWYFNRMGVFPTTPYDDLSVVVKDVYGGNYDDALDAKENLSRLSTHTGNAVLIIQKGVNREIDFNLLTVLDQDYVNAHDLNTNRIAGLNKKILARFDVVKDMNLRKGDSPAFDFIGQPTEKYIVLETNGEKYRVLGRGFGQHTVERELIDKIKKGVSLRPQAYHDICEYYILNRAGEARRRNLLSYYDEMKRVSPSVDAMKKAMLKDLVDEVKITGKLTNLEDFEQLCRSNYTHIISRHIMKFLEMDKIESREVRVTTAVKLDDLLREFRRKLETAMRKVLHPGLFVHRKDMEAHLRAIYHDIMKDVIEDMDAPPSKWQSLDIGLKEFYIQHRGYEF
jgi:hypothetical protein